MNDDYDQEDLIEAVERLNSLKNKLDGLIYDSVLEPIDDVIRQAFLARRHINKLEKTQ